MNLALSRLQGGRLLYNLVQHGDPNVNAKAVNKCQSLKTHAQELIFMNKKI